MINWNIKLLLYRKPDNSNLEMYIILCLYFDCLGCVELCFGGALSVEQWYVDKIISTSFIKDSNKSIKVSVNET